MSIIAAYTERDNPLHRLDPRTKMLWSLGMVVLAIATRHPEPLLAGLGLVVLVSLAAGLDVRHYLPLVKAMIPVTIAVLILQLIYAGGPTFAAVGPIELHVGGFEAAFTVVCRILLIVFVSLQFFMWVHPTDLALTFVSFRLPYRYALLIGLSLRTFPVLERELRRIYDSQAARGLELEGSVRKIIRLIPIMLPFLLRALRRSGEIAMAMELRAFGYAKERTYLRSLRFTAADWAATVLLLASGAVYFAWYSTAF